MPRPSSPNPRKSPPKPQTLHGFAYVTGQSPRAGVARLLVLNLAGRRPELMTLDVQESTALVGLVTGKWYTLTCSPDRLRRMEDGVLQISEIGLNLLGSRGNQSSLQDLGGEKGRQEIRRFLAQHRPLLDLLGRGDEAAFAAWVAGADKASQVAATLRSAGFREALAAVAGEGAGVYARAGALPADQALSQYLAPETFDILWGPPRDPDPKKDQPAQWMPVPIPLLTPEGSLLIDGQHDGYLRIGYTVLDGQADAIAISRESQVETVPALRTAHAALKNSGQHRKQVTLKLDLTAKDLPTQMVPLLRQLDRTPFLPVANRVLNDVEGIDALAIQSFTVTTVPGYPERLNLEIVAQPFHWQGYMPQEGGFGETFCWPLFRAWCDLSRSGSRIRPPAGPWTGELSFQLLEDEALRASQAMSVEGAPERLPALETVQAALTWLDHNPRDQKTLDALERKHRPSLQGDLQVRDLALLRLGSVDGYTCLLRTEDLDTAVALLRSAASDLHAGIRDRIRVWRRLPWINNNDQINTTGTHGPQGLPVLPRDPAAPPPVGPIYWLQGGNEVEEDVIRKAAELLDDLRRAKQPQSLHPEQADLRLQFPGWTFQIPVHRRGVLRQYLAEQRQTHRTTEKAQKARYTPVYSDERRTFPSLVLQQISISRQNILIELPMSQQALPIHQHLGSTNKLVRFIGNCDAADLQGLEELLDQVDEQVRATAHVTLPDVGRDVQAGFLRANNEVLALLGIEAVLPLTLTATTMQGFPGMYEIELTCLEYDADSRHRESPERMDDDTLFARWSNEGWALSDVPGGVNPAAGTHARGHHDNLLWRTIYTGLTQKAVTAEVYHQELRKFELYPDLELPTWQELSDWIRAMQDGSILDRIPDWNWTAEDVQVLEPPLLPEAGSGFFGYVDPDFYCAAQAPVGRDWVDHLVEETRSATIHCEDTAGGAADRQWNGEYVNLNAEAKAWTDFCDQNPGAWLPPLGTGPAAEAGSYNAAVLDEKSLGDWAYQSGLLGESWSELGRPFVIQQLSRRPQGYRPEDLAAYTARWQAGRDRYEKSGTPAWLKARAKAHQAQAASAKTAPLGGPRSPYDPLIAAAAVKHGVDPNLAKAMAWQESRIQPGKTSRSGARGIFQLMPSTAAGLGVDPDDPAQNIEGGIRYFKQQLDRFGGDPLLALAAYNAGPGAVKKFGGVPPYRETQLYVQKVLAKYAEYHHGARIMTRERLRDTKAARIQQGREWVKTHQPTSEKRAQILVAGPGVPPVLPTDEEVARARQDTATFQADLAELLHRAGKYLASQGIKNPRYLKLADARRVASGKTGGLDDEDYGYLGLALGLPENAQVAQRVYDSDRVALEQQLGHVPTVSGPKPPSPDEAMYREDGKDIFFDLRQTCQYGRLLHAFPAFQLTLIDGGAWLRYERYWDHWYGLFSVTDLLVHQTRKEPAAFARITLNNLYGHLTNRLAELIRERRNEVAVHGYGMMKAVVGLVEKMREALSTQPISKEMEMRWSQHLNSLFLKPGARVSLRMGYGGNAARLPVVFNGVITAVPLSEGTVTLECLGDGYELTNTLKPNTTEHGRSLWRVNSFLGQGVNPRDLIMRLMAPASLGRVLARGRINVVTKWWMGNENPYGIVHFGDPQMLWLRQDESDVGLNVYSPLSGETYSVPIDNAIHGMKLWRWAENDQLIGIQLEDATPWEIFQTCKRAVPDYILAVAPFETQSTLFYGKPWFKFRYGYKLHELSRALEWQPGVTPIPGTQLRTEVQNGRLVLHDIEDLDRLTYWKPYLQCHVIHSGANLLETRITADAQGVYTACTAVGTYQPVEGMGPLNWVGGGGREESGATFLADSDILNEHQRHLKLNTGLYSTGTMKVLDSQKNTPKEMMIGAGVGAGVAIIGGLLAPFTGGLSLGLVLGGALAGAGTAAVMGVARGITAFFFSRDVVNGAAVDALAESLRDMYKGSFLILGDGTVKPQDLCHVNDLDNSLVGPIGVKGVTHRFGFDSGFVTEVQPDAVTTALDDVQLTMAQNLCSLGGRLAEAWALRLVIGRLTRMASQTMILRILKAAEREAEYFVRFGDTRGLASATEATARASRSLRDQLGTVERDRAAAEARLLREAANLDDATLAARAEEIRERYAKAAQAARDTHQKTLEAIGEGMKDLPERQKAAQEFIETVRKEREDLETIYRTIRRKGVYVLEDGTRLQGWDLWDHYFARVQALARSRALEALDKGGKRFLPEALRLRLLGTLRIAGLRHQLSSVVASGRAWGGAVWEETLNPLWKRTVAAASARFAGNPRLSALMAWARREIDQMPGVFREAARLGSQRVFWLVSLIAATGIGELARRFLASRQCVQILPLAVAGREYSAGINGHQGLVVGEHPSPADSFWDLFETPVEILTGEEIGARG